MDLGHGAHQFTSPRLDAHAFRPDSGHRALVRRLQRSVIGEPSSTTSSKKGQPVFDLQDETSKFDSNASRLSIQFEAPIYSASKYALYKKYQIEVHKDSPEHVSLNGFERFLCATPLTNEAFADDGNDGVDSYGTVHAVYRLKSENPDEESDIIALAVLDILPHCVSSVYFAYDPAYGKMSLGKVSAGGGESTNLAKQDSIAL